jgi:DNA modification methylase
MSQTKQGELFDTDVEADDQGSGLGDISFADNKTLRVHRWVPWIAGFSSEFVGGIINENLTGGSTVLDPFAGVGTTLIEGAKRGHNVIGFEINPYAVMACRVKLNARKVDLVELRKEIERFGGFYLAKMKNGYEPESAPPEGFNTRAEFYAPKVERKVLTFWDYVNSMEKGEIRDLFRIAFASKMIKFSNYSYEPSLGTRKAADKPRIEDYPVGEALHGKLEKMAEDIEWLQEETDARETDAKVVHESFFNCRNHIEANTADLVVTSPPYLNNYHYIRNTRPHLYWMGFADTPKDYKPLEHRNYGKYWQTVRDDEDVVDLDFSNPPDDLNDLIGKLRELNPEKGVYGGNGWANYAATYFNDSYRFGKGLIHTLKPGAKAYVVVGNSILQGINFETDKHLANVCERAGMKIEDVHTPRDARVGNSIIQSEVRVTKAKQSHRLYESVVELRRP